MTLSVPVSLFIFNRPDKTKIVFDVIKQVEPKTLFIIADGPRNVEETNLCLQTRYIVENIDWECTIFRNYSDKNRGCKYRISSGLDWVFSKCDQSIILEDDCIPHSSFFKFCEILLDEYRDDKRVMHISGDYFSLHSGEKHYSYYFSKYPHVWGWATWKRAWQSYDVNINLWNDPVARNAVLTHFSHPQEKSFWLETFTALNNGLIDTWDYQWAFNCFVNNGLAINPSMNLVSNIGFSSDATHTRSSSNLSNIPTCEMKFPLNHPPFVLTDKLEDEFVGRKFFYKEGWFQKSINKIRRDLKQLGLNVYGKL